MTTRSIATYERQLKAAQREADIERVAALEKSLVSLHRDSFPKAERKVLPAPEPVDPEPIRSALEAEVGIPNLLGQLGGGDSPPVAAPPEPVDRYQLMREFRRRRRQGIAFWRIREQVEVARIADREAEAAAEVEVGKRKVAHEAEQAELDRRWAQLQQARVAVEQLLPQRLSEEKERREADRAVKQKVLDQTWEKLQANDPNVTLPLLKRAFADNEAPARPVKCNGNRTSIVMRFSAPETLIPERKPARTPTGKRTLKKRNKTEINALYVEALGSNVLATVKEAFAAAPGTEIVEFLAIRQETDGKNIGDFVPIYFGEFHRSGYDAASGSRDPGVCSASLHNRC
jgi:hypothetical protein